MLERRTRPAGRPATKGPSHCREGNLLRLEQPTAREEPRGGGQAATIAWLYSHRDSARRPGLLRRFWRRITRRLLARGPSVELRGRQSGGKQPIRIGPKRRLLRERDGRNALKRAMGYLAGVFILGFSLWQATRILSDYGSESGMVNVLLGIFSGIVVLFLLSHDTAVSRRQRAEEQDGA
ncbi:MAG: hypothetical protein HYY25_00130 [Candidatus Wallbacteria bacterium]|nr:hypothetical protein [Candidatus Wallbacteria bacterium]